MTDGDETGTRRAAGAAAPGTDAGGRFASPPCLAEEVAPGWFDPLAVDPQQARDVARWRRAERARLSALREGLGVEGRARVGAAIAARLAEALEARGVGPGVAVSGYWPLGGEPDLRPLMAELHRRGATVAAPAVARRAAPLAFRRWTPETRMARDAAGIPAPPPEAGSVTPDVTVAPCLGWDPGCHRLGWGGGYFDRTLAALAPRPFVVGVALTAARLDTIFPQPHDVPLDLIVTEDGVAAERELAR